jgi:hypothetical protein
MQAQLDRNLKQATLKEQMVKRMEAKKQQQQLDADRERAAASERAKTQISDEELFKCFSTGEKVEKTPRQQSVNGGKKKKSKK